MHDLPPFWDGLAVVWDGWQAPMPVYFICPPRLPKECCPACGCLDERTVNRGRVALTQGVTHEEICAQDEARDRLPWSLRVKIGRNALYRLTAHRCPSCKHDEVWDMDTNEWWRLDASDYTDEGSSVPAASR